MGWPHNVETTLAHTVPYEDGNAALFRIFVSPQTFSKGSCISFSIASAGKL
jgi:hypothetical protein